MNIVLDRTISSPLILSGFIIGLIIWISNSVISAIAIHRKYVSNSFGYSALILGGIGIHLIIILFAYTKRKIKSNNKHVYLQKGKRIVITSLMTFFAGGVTAFFALSLSTNNYDSPFLGNPVEFSTQQDKPNVIEIFTDGFDQWNRDDYKDDQDFKDFNWFDKFQTVGTQTHRSVPSIWGDFKKDNPFEVRKDTIFKEGENLRTHIYGETFLSSGIRHIGQNINKFSQRNIINTICMSDDPGYSPSTSGVPKAVVARDQKENVDSNPGSKVVNVTNWSGARDYESGKMGFSNLSPDGNSYKYFSDSSKSIDYSANSHSDGAYVLINDLITHKPYMSTASGAFTTFNTSAQDQKSSLRKNLKYLFQKLKTKVINGRNAYENSMIIVYGDHANHYRHLKDDAGKDVNYRHGESALMIKYPNESHDVTTGMNVINDREVYSASINNIINHFVSGHGTASTELGWMGNEAAFDMGQARPTFTDDNTYKMLKWEKDPERAGEWKLSLANPNGFNGVTYKDWLDGTVNDDLGSVVF